MPAASVHTQPFTAPGLGQTQGGFAPPGLGQTQAGFVPPEAAPPPATARPTGPAALKATVMGMGMTPSTPPVAPPPASTAAAPPTKPQLRGTMIGMAPPTPEVGPAPTHSAADRASAPAPNLRGTMIGMAPPTPADAPLTEPGLGAAPATLPHGVNIPLGPGGGTKTMLGIARPGIAPLHPGVEKAAAPAPVQVAGARIPAHAAVPPAFDTVAGLPRPLRIPAGAALAIVGAAALLTAAVVALLLYRARGAVEATLGSAPDGRDLLSLVCHGCADGSTVSAGSAHATFRGGRADLALEQKLAVGANTVPVALERRPGHAERVELSVPVDFRVRADTSGLVQAPPRVIVRVETVPHAAVVIDGKPLALAASPGGSETGSAEIDVARTLTGASSVVGMLERKIQYVVTPPSGNPVQGDVSVRLGVTPLVVQAPGPSIVIEASTFVLAGHTAKDATVTVEGRPITVDGAGAFAQMMSVSSLGETNINVRADAKDQAPRLVPVRVRRVQSLAAEAGVARANATTSYAAIARDPDSQRGLAVALDGNVVEARVDAFTTVIVLDVKSGCASAPCLARVSVGEKAPLKDGSSVSVFGAITGAVEGPHQGTRIPAIAADFVLKGRP
jgi:hypothetical protein